MRSKIAGLLESRGELTFGELCREMNVFDPAGIGIVRNRADSMLAAGEASMLGECAVTNSTILFPRRVGTDNPATNGDPYP